MDPIKKIILFGDFAGKDFDDFWHRDYLYIKTSALLRLSYMLRKKGYIVKQVHHCTSFNRDELNHILDEFSEGQQILVGISSSFLSSVNKIDYNFHASDREEAKDWPEGGFWGAKAFEFLTNICQLSKAKNFPLLMGGFDVLKYKFWTVEDVYAWGLDMLTSYVDYFVIGNNTDIIEKVCNHEKFRFEPLRGSLSRKPAKIAYSQPIQDYSDVANTVMPYDIVSEGECLITEIAAGCVFSCSFCTYSNLGKQKSQYARTYDSFKNEIVSNWENFGVRVYQMTDNMINDWSAKLEYLARVRDETGIDVRWSGYARLDTIQKRQQARMFKESGCAGVVFGIESQTKEVGPYIGKMTDHKKIVDLLHQFRDEIGDYAITSGSYIAGAPGESKEQLAATYEWLQSPEGRNLIDHFIFTPLFITPGINDLNDINRSRQDPFRDYKLVEGEISKRGIGWTSPWGKYEDFLKIAIDYSKWLNKSTTVEEAMVALRGPFAIPQMQNFLPGGVERFVASIRAKEPIHYLYAKEMRKKNNQMISYYRQKTLGNKY